MTDKRDVCGCHRDCVITPHACLNPCRWPECLTSAESDQLAAGIAIEHSLQDPFTGEITVRARI